MSVSIYFFVEKRFYRNDDLKKEKGVWISIDKWLKDPNWTLYPEKRDKSAEWHTVDNLLSGSIGELKDLLADVSNPDGLIQPISQPKGLPNDLSPEIYAASKWDEENYFRHSWFTLSELIDFDWNQRVRCKLYVVPQYAQIFREKYPDGVVEDKSIFEDYSKWPEENKVNCGELGILEFEETYRFYFRWFYENVVQKLMKIGESEDVRVIFWFGH